MDKSLRNTLLNSTLAFLAAFFMTTFIHEFGHFVSYLIGGSHPVLYHNYVSISDEESDIHIRIISVMAGPVISLFQGIIFGIIVSMRRNRIAHLFYLWLSLLGFVNFFGYLMMTPISTIGDTGKVAEMLGIGSPAKFMVAIAGFIILIWIIFRTGKYFSSFIPEGKDLRERRKYVYCIMFLPVIIGSLVKTLFAFPIPAWISIFYTATSSFVIMLSFGIILKNPVPQTGKMPVQEKISFLLIMLVLLVIIVNRLLTLGLG
jgi:hypothetical protein